MQLLSELNNEGITVCMVTHDERYARYSKTTLTLWDGKLIENETAISLAGAK
jgi:putative ABC transport system ATP-binding protein